MLGTYKQNMLLNTWHWLLPSFIVDGITYIGTCVEDFILQDRRKEEQVLLFYNNPFSGKLNQGSMSTTLTPLKVKLLLL